MMKLLDQSNRSTSSKPPAPQNKFVMLANNGAYLVNQQYYAESPGGSHMHMQQQQPGSVKQYHATFQQSQQVRSSYRRHRVTTEQDMIYMPSQIQQTVQQQ